MKTSGMSMRRVGDGATGGETTEPRFAQVSIEIQTAECEPWIESETLDDARIDLDADFAQEDAIGFTEGSVSEFV